MDKLPTAKFTKLNEQFACLNCGQAVATHPSSSRDHCTNCLWGQHVDINPGDRANQCQGKLKPIGMEMKNSKQRVVYRCDKCRQLIRNIVAPDDSIEAIIQLTKQVWTD